MSKCNSCPRRCNIDRTKQKGICGVGEELTIARAGIHYGEEPCISGTNGSGTIFFSGCNLKCVMCQNYQISHEGFGKIVSKSRFIEIMQELEAKGAHNINLVTPNHYFDRISDALKEYRPSVPLIYNSSGYDTVENIQKNLFDVYLFDLKYFSREKSKRYSKCTDYFDVACKAIKEAVNLVGKPIYDSDGILKSGVIVRHMILPRSTNDSIYIIKWLNENVPEVILSLMSQYVPMYKASDYPEINRKITMREYNKVLKNCYDTNFSDVYIQKLSSSTTDMIPDFDLTGI